MKKAGIITHYNVHNHGAVLQLYALIKVLNKLGFSAKALQFDKNYDFMGGSSATKKYNISLKSIPTYLKYLFKNGLLKTLYNIKKRKLLNSFRNDENLIGDFYSLANDLDVVVIGSDEIFSVEAGPNPWYYGIGVPCKYQVSYAASFGPTTLAMIYDKNMDGMLKGAISNLKYITVRDQNSEYIINSLTGKDSIIVCDPVLLYGFKEAMMQRKFMIKERYCIVYSYDSNMNDNATVDSIKSYAKEHKLTVISVGYYHKWCDKNINVSPLDIFDVFANSEMVFTDTFHGTVISLTTQAQFVTKIRGNANKLEFLLSQFGVKERKVDEFSEVSNLQKIDYAIINENIRKIREFSLAQLEKSLEGVKHNG